MPCFGSFTLPKFVSETVSDSDTQQPHDSHNCACIGHLGQRNTDRINSINAAASKVARAGRKTISRCDISGIIPGVIALNFANVKTA